MGLGQFGPEIQDDDIFGNLIPDTVDTDLFDPLCLGTILRGEEDVDMTVVGGIE